MSLLDMIGPVMIGPSSSHTAGACRLGLVAHHLLGEAPRRAKIGLHASFAKTGRGHGTHLALIAGLLGFAPDDARLPQAFEEAKAAGLEFEFRDVDLGDVHPNTAHIELSGETQKVTVQGSSTGGGVILVTQVQGLGVNFSASSPTVLLRYTDAVGMIARIASTIAADGVNIAALTCTRQTRGGQALLAIELDAPLSDQALAFLDYWPDTNWVRLLPKLMDG
ncbi:L-serine ammonia-lyase, iron-sulfur-dependent, subunit beta [Deinococcus sp. D7000]|uniref:L-serine dehydratase n=1 Tax=Deinococcus radiopugnans ATCC 19172 TaxID=585398 RepID=A0A5C4Y205_9DEIO|nr:L-serine ammonia-lyase, iron-sulfur-dependent subunit beta [Deinococcus radiopugnans]MBB6017920.1 L-serine dehydratase [Deinococcus radiopugnans ATCC 19172]QLG10576.1 L-serine ammonia-lyase, iron-sulfur-dependent, subunit beta [Deinococcus sp. D7000]TNM68978.1 L-serine ammonia-lyase, iron-sulfur-dependent, subunit beta [Deinococcus radiopugnans ATCC 19172]